MRVLLLAALVACGQNYNSNSLDNQASGADCSSDTYICPAYNALKSNHCFECHSWSNYTTNVDWENAGLVVPGSPSTSQLIKQLKNSGGDMPKDYSALSTSDLNDVVTWIQNL